MAGWMRQSDHIKRRMTQPPMPLLDFLAMDSDWHTRKYWMMFATKGYSCVRCNIVGTHVLFWSEYNWRMDVDQLHCDLVAIKTDSTGTDHYMLMTMDHILPRSRGGPDALENMQPMCTNCNGAKGNSLEPEHAGIQTVRRQETAFTIEARVRRHMTYRVLAEDKSLQRQKVAQQLAMRYGTNDNVLFALSKHTDVKIYRNRKTRRVESIHIPDDSPAWFWINNAEKLK